MEAIIRPAILFLSAISILYSLYVPHQTKDLEYILYPNIDINLTRIEKFPVSTRVYAHKRVLSLRRSLNSIIRGHYSTSFIDILIDGGHPLRVYELSILYRIYNFRIKKNRNKYGIPEVFSIFIYQSHYY